ncbi:amidase signature enzyme [Astrocystis sublimbata]|nr:amidase signature enzyme [Astrocystis sublimbata]
MKFESGPRSLSSLRSSSTECTAKSATGSCASHSTGVATLIDVLTVTSTELQQFLSKGYIQSVDLVEIYLDQIERENHSGLELNAMISTTPKHILHEIAKELDAERRRGIVRGPLHGIPISVKDNIMTGLKFGLPTTVGTFALKNAIATENAPVVDLLINAGAIIIGKTNLSEMAGFKGFGVTTGWSVLGGQTQSPYIDGGFKDRTKILDHSAPGGSSSGSAVGVAAGFSPLALATETDGSIVQPSNRAALYGMKATVGLISAEGTAPWSPVTDSIGGMAKSPEDLANLFSVLLNTDLTHCLSATWSDQRVGVVDPGLWSFSPVICDPDTMLIQQQREELEAVVDKIQTDGAKIKRPVPLPSMDNLVLDGDDALEQIWNHDFNVAWEEYLRGYKDINISSIHDIVDFNKKNSEKALPKCYPGQQLLEECIDATKIISQTKYDKAIELIRKVARVEGIDKIMNEYNLDVIIGPMDGRIPTIAAAAGYPVGTMPLGYSETNGRPFGVCIIARAGQEDKILRAMSAWELSVGKRKPPPLVPRHELALPLKTETSLVPNDKAKDYRLYGPQAFINGASLKVLSFFEVIKRFVSIILKQL